MSFENLNAENRNMFPLNTRRNLEPQLLVAPYRRNHCSFCRCNDHNRRACVYASISDSTYREFEAICSAQVMNTNTQDEFKNWLIENYSEEQDLLRGFTLKKFRYITIEPLNSITEYMFITYKDQTVIQDEDEFLETELNLFLAQLSNQTRERIIFPEIEEVRAMESILLRDFIEAIMNSPVNMIRNENEKLNILSSIENNESENKKCECSICLDENEINNFIKLGCNHEFCKDCVIKTIKTTQTRNTKLCCALCRSEVKSVTSRTEIIYNEMAEFVA